MSEFWRTPQGREARNEQRKLRGGIANALAITLTATALVGDLVNPTVAELLSTPARIGMLTGALLMHFLASFFVRDMEDKQ